MKVTCPGCSATYNVPESKLQKDITQTGCRRCGANLVFIRSPEPKPPRLPEVHPEAVRAADLGEPPEKKGFPLAKVLKYAALGVVVLVVAGALFIYGLFYMTKRSDAYKAARGWVSQNREVRDAVGGRIDQGPDMISFNVKSSGDTGRADMTFAVHGPGGSTDVRVLLIKERGTWRVTKAAYLGPSGRPVMLPLQERPRAKLAKKRAPPKKTGKEPEEKKIDPKEQARGHIDTAHRLFGQKRYADSAKEYSKAIELDPKNAKAYYWRGVAHIRRGDSTGGLSDMKQAVALDPKNAKAHEYLGWLYGTMGRYAKATSHFTRVIELKPRYGKAYYQRGAAYFKRGDSKRGMKDMEKACGLGYKPGCDAMLSFRKAI